MKTIYVADDGKEFDDEYDCQDYEWYLNHSNLKDVQFYDAENNELNHMNIFVDEVCYLITEKVVVPNEDALRDLLEYADYTGFLSYKDIDECGEWIFDDKKEGFVKV